MATLVLSAVGGAIGGAVGGSVLGVSAAVIGRAVGATVGRMIDQRYTSQGSATVEYGRIDRYRITGASQGAAIPRMVGRLRLGGQVIWATRYKETAQTETTSTGGGKGGGGARSTQTTTTYSYSVSLAIALCEGEIQGVGRIWADGVEVNPSLWDMRVYPGSETQAPDPLIETIEGSAPAYRGTAYVVIEDLPLGDYGNRVPQLTFEVFRYADPKAEDVPSSPMRDLTGVALLPGSGEYALATAPVYYDTGLGAKRVANVNGNTDETDFVASIRAMKIELPKVRAATLITSWFGDDLRCDRCTIAPRVEQKDHEGDRLPWRVAGLTRGAARNVSLVEGKPAFGGTPDDASAIEAIQHLKAQGIAVVSYPFIMMDVPAENTLTNPYDPSQSQPVFPWRGRITTSLAKEVEGTPNGTAAADAEVAQFFGSVQAAHFSVSPGQVTYTGPDEWSFTRFILHHAALCAAAGGVEAITIGSEMRGLTQIMGQGESFPAVAHLKTLAAEVRMLLPHAKIGYAADWSEYFGYQPGGGDVYFHLDPLWADDNIDFIGIDNYMPLSDWRDEPGHLDAQWQGSKRAYFDASIEGGEGYDWYYTSEADRLAQTRTPIGPDPHGDDWTYRYKDLKGWWTHYHYNRRGGAQVPEPTEWVPQSKPFWFTEFGCPAVDKGATEPNLFADGHSSESALPHCSTGQRDDFEQMEYFAAHLSHWRKGANNPISEIYEGPMVETSRMFGWAWDGRPWPAFPARSDVWSDHLNYAKGHWLNGRSLIQPLAAVVAELCAEAGLTEVDVSALRGVVRGASFTEVQSVRADLQPLMLGYGIEAQETGTGLVFRMAEDAPTHAVDFDSLALSPEQSSRFEKVRAAPAELADRLKVNFIDAENTYKAITTEAIWPGTEARTSDTLELPLALLPGEALETAERVQATGRGGDETYSFALPPSHDHIAVGDLITFDAETEPRMKITRLSEQGMRQVEAIRVNTTLHTPSGDVIATDTPAPSVQPGPKFTQFLDLPLLTGNEDVYSPYVAVASRPWTGDAAIYASRSDAEYSLADLVHQPAVMGETLTPLARARAGVWDRGAGVEVELIRGELSSVSRDQVLNGANAMAIRHGEAGEWEVFQFAQATLVGERRYRLTELLRGQRGTDWVMPTFWPEGSIVVVLNEGVSQIERSPDEAGLPVNYRIGPAQYGYTHSTYTQQTHTHHLVGARPFRPVHLTVKRDPNGDLSASWTRRTRVGGDLWNAVEVPLSESFEKYLWRLSDESGGVLEHTVDAPSMSITASDLAAANFSGPLTFEVAQVSELYGAGPFAARTGV